MQRDIDEVEMLLDVWADDMRRWKNEAAGYPAEASGGFIHSWRKDFEEAVEEADRRMVEGINACIDSLPPSYRDAINRRYRLGADVFRFPQPRTFDEAKTAVRVFFVKRGLL